MTEHKFNLALKAPSAMCETFQYIADIKLTLRDLEAQRQHYEELIESAVGVSKEAIRKFGFGFFGSIMTPPDDSDDEIDIEVRSYTEQLKKIQSDIDVLNAELDEAQADYKEFKKQFRAEKMKQINAFIHDVEDECKDQARKVVVSHGTVSRQD